MSPEPKAPPLPRRSVASILQQGVSSFTIAATSNLNNFNCELASGGKNKNFSRNDAKIFIALKMHSKF